MEHYRPKQNPTTTMKRYDKYKPSGIDWIGEVPEHWEEKKLKFVVSCNDEVLDEKTDANTIIRYVEISDVNAVDGVNNFTEYEFGKAPSRARRITRKNDIIVSTVRTYLKAIAKIKDDDLIVSTDFAVLRAKGIDVDYLAFTSLSQFFIDAVISDSVGVSYPSINTSQLVNIKIAVPPLAEQEAIAAYLDARCADIDKVVATQEKRIALLQELKQSEITQAVTRGLNPDVRMKDSGVEWIGMVPEHWEVIPFKSKFKTDKGLSITKADLVDEGVPVISYGQIHSKQNDYVHTLDHLLRFIPEEMAPADSKAKLEIGDIVFADTSEDVEGSGNAFYIDREGIYAGYHTVIAKSIERVDNKYFSYLFATPVWRSQVRSQVYGVKVFSITQQILKSTSLIAPPVEERKQIVEVLEEKCARIDKQIEKIQNQIELLREYKQALITEVVTGKRRV